MFQRCLNLQSLCAEDLVAISFTCEHLFVSSDVRLQPGLCPLVHYAAHIKKLFSFRGRLDVLHCGTWAVSNSVGIPIFRLNIVQTMQWKWHRSYRSYWWQTVQAPTWEWGEVGGKIELHLTENLLCSLKHILGLWQLISIQYCCCTYIYYRKRRRK